MLRALRIRLSCLVITDTLGTKELEGYNGCSCFTGRPAAWPTGCQKRELDFKSNASYSALAPFRELKGEGGRTIVDREFAFRTETTDTLETKE